MTKQTIDKYKVVADSIPAIIVITKIEGESVPLYEVTMPSVGKATEALMTEFMDDLADKVPVDVESINDPNKIEEMRRNFYRDTHDYLEKKFTRISKEQLDALAGVLVHKMYGLDFLEVIMADDFLEEVAVNGAQQSIAVYHKKHGWCKTTIQPGSEEEIYNFSAQVGRRSGREINSLNPIMDSHLISGDRVASTLFPISTAGNTITIRRFSRNPWTPTNLIKAGAMNVEIAAFIWQAMQYELNIIVAGGTASGKTSALNALCSFIPSSQRVISIEDTREIDLPKQLEWNWVPLTSRNKNPEGQGEVTMLDLMIASLRMRPDRIVVGEVRQRQQAETMFEAMHTGHSVVATMHADTTEQLKRRILEPPISIPKTEAEALHLVFIQYRDRRKGTRRMLELAEILTGGKDDLDVHYLYRYRPRADTWENVYESVRVKEELNLHTGMTDEEIADDRKEKASVLKWLMDNDVTDINQFGEVMHKYYTDKPALLRLIKSNDLKSVLR
jgi:flagellar protein FlaI